MAQDYVDQFLPGVKVDVELLAEVIKMADERATRRTFKKLRGFVGLVSMGATPSPESVKWADKTLEEFNQPFNKNTVEDFKKEK